MSKNIIIGLLAIVSLLSLAYGYSQKVRADKLEVLAVENATRAKQAEMMAEGAQQEAERQRAMAEMDELMARQQEALLQEALRKARAK